MSRPAHSVSDMLERVVIPYPIEDEARARTAETFAQLAPLCSSAYRDVTLDAFVFIPREDVTQAEIDAALA